MLTSTVLHLFQYVIPGSELYGVQLETFNNLFERRCITKRDRLCLLDLAKSHPVMCQSDAQEVIDWWELL